MWEKVKFTDIVKDITGGNKKLSQDKYLEIGKYPIIDQGEKFIGGYYNEDFTIKLERPIVIFGDHSKCIKYIDFKFILGADGVKVLQPNENLNTKYLYYFLHTITLPNVGYSRHFKFLKELEIPLPPLHIQEKIAEILDKADELRRKDQELQDKYDQLAQAIFIDMFGDPVKNEKGWEVKKLEELGVWKAGGTPSRNKKEYFDGNIPWVSSGELNELFISDSKEKINEDAINNSSAKLIEPYSLLLGMYDTAALKSSINTVYLTCNQAIAFSNIKYGNLIFIYNIIQLTKEHHKSKQRGVRQKNLNLSMIKEIEIIFPPIHLQEEFAKKIEIIHQLKAQTNAVKSEELFQSLLQRAFKGELVS